MKEVGSRTETYSTRKMISRYSTSKEMPSATNTHRASFWCKKNSAPGVNSLSLRCQFQRVESLNCE
jgi:hypothetical protein